MGTSANKAAPTSSPDPRPTGDLEYLFRQKLGEAEVAPRLQLWEQLDHDLLVQQNETYRKRLLVHRWVAAACVLLLLSAGGWLGLQQLQPSTSPGLAGTTAANRTAAGYSATATGRGTTTAQTGSLAASESDRVGQANAEMSTAAGPLGEASSANRLLAALSQPGGSSMEQGVYTREQLVGAGASAGFANTFTRSGSGSPVFAAYAPAATVGSHGTEANASTWDLLAARAARLGSALGRLTHPDTLKPSLLATPPMLAAVTPPMEEEEKKKIALGGWRFGGSHAVSAFNPNINFAQASAQTTTSAINNLNFLDSRGVQTVAYEAGAAEYRQNLRAGVGQRVALTAARAAGKHWVLLAGVEAAEYRASSETSFSSVAQSETAFAGRATTAAYQMAPNSFSNSAAYARDAVAYTATPRATTYRYRTVGVPVAARYGSQKTGVSLYAKVGAAVDLLLGSRVEVANETAATREYSLNTAESPYRQVIATVRGGGGVQYRPAGATWAILAGPTAEAGLTTLNRDPAQALLRRSRPYMVGIEASVEFGGGKAVTAH